MIFVSLNFQDVPKKKNVLENLILHFESHFGTLWLPLGSILGPLEVSWEASGPKNV